MNSSSAPIQAHSQPVGKEKRERRGKERIEREREKRSGYRRGRRQNICHGWKGNEGFSRLGVLYFFFPRVVLLLVSLSFSLSIILPFSPCTRTRWYSLSPFPSTFPSLLLPLSLSLSLSRSLFLSVWLEKLPVSDTRLRFNYSSNLFPLAFLRINDDLLLDCNHEKNQREAEWEVEGGCVGRFCPVFPFSTAGYNPLRRRRENPKVSITLKRSGLSCYNGHEESTMERLAAVHYAACRGS